MPCAPRWLIGDETNPARPLLELKQPPDDGLVVVERLDHRYVHLLILARKGGIRAN
jgi:hypothetical protein